VESRILVIGELNVDLIVSGLPALPSLGQEILASGLNLALGGSSAICAAGLARLGAKVEFLGKVGGDDYGEFVTDQLRLLGVGTAHVIHDSAVRTGITISLTYPEERALITYPGCIPHLRLERSTFPSCGATALCTSVPISSKKGCRLDYRNCSIRRISKDWRSRWTPAMIRMEYGGVTACSRCWGVWTSSCPTRRKPALSPASTIPRRPCANWRNGPDWW
jgi:hypothetical protein